MDEEDRSGLDEVWSDLVPLQKEFGVHDRVNSAPDSMVNVGVDLI